MDEQTDQRVNLGKYPLKWVRLEKYCELSGDSVSAVRARRLKGEWLDERETQCKNRRLWVNLPLARKWIERAKQQFNYEVKCTVGERMDNYPIEWVRLSKYCELSAETPGAVRSRRLRGEWLDGRETTCKNRRLWVNLKAAEKWVTRCW